MTATRGFVVAPGSGRSVETSPGRATVLKLLGRETNGSVMLFEQTVPAGTKSWYHLHHDSDEVAWVLEGEITFRIGDEVSVGGPGACAFMPRGLPHAWKNTGDGPGRVVFLYTPAAAGAFVEAMVERPARPRSDEERDADLRRYRWEIVGSNPL